jgi:hypothetical protein
MNRLAIGLLGSLLMSAHLHATEPFVIIDYTKIDARQYCVYNGQLYTRGIRIKTDTGTYTCRVATDSKVPGQSDAGRDMVIWVRETI